MTILQRVSSLVALAMLSLAAAAPSRAQDYPSHPVKMIVPFGAGGPTDIFTRLLAEELRKALKEPFVMENRPGAGTIIGTEAAAKSPPDGYTLLMISATQTTTETLVPNKSFKLMRDFVPVASLLNSELVMVVHPSVGVNTVQEFIALAKSKPGARNYASSGVGSNYHMAGELFKNLTGTNILHVPYKGSAGARNDIISGQIEMMFDSVPSMAQMIQVGRVKALGTTGKVRSAILPDVPTLAEAGVPGYEATIWIGVMAPAGTPQPIVTLLNTEINKILARADIKEAWRKQGAETMSMQPDEFGTFVQSEKDSDVRLFLWNKHAGDPSAPAGRILFVHGSSMASQPTFDLQVPGRADSSVMDFFAARGYDTWCVDMEGYGRSTKTRDNNAPIAYGADDCFAAATYIEKMRGERPLLVYGISSGALRAALFAQRHPAMVARLALDAMVWTGEGSPTLAERSKRLPEFRAKNRRPIDRKFVRSIFERDHPGTADDVVIEAFADAILKLDDSVPTGTYVDMCANLPVCDPEKITAPTLIMRGQYDGIASFADLLKFFERLPNPDKQFAVMPGIAHASFHQKNYMICYHILESFFSQPAPIYKGGH